MKLHKSPSTNNCMCKVAFCKLLQGPYCFYFLRFYYLAVFIAPHGGIMPVIRGFDFGGTKGGNGGCSLFCSRHTGGVMQRGWPRPTHCVARGSSCQRKTPPDEPAAPRSEQPFRESGIGLCK